MSESLTHIVEGAIGKEGVLIDCVAGGAIDLWAPVILAAAGTGEDLPRVTTTTTANDPKVFGVAVSKKDSGKAADAAGEIIKVCIWGRTKVKVDGTVNIAIGDCLVTTTTAGKAGKGDYTSADNTVGNINAAILALAAVFAVALKASTADGDIIPCFVKGARGTSA